MLCLHHVIPLSMGGTNNISNIVVLCDECHSKIHGMNWIKQGELIKKGIAKARLTNPQWGCKKGAKLVTKKSIEKKELIKKYSKDFNGNLSDVDCMKLIGIARNTYYKYKKELKYQNTNN